MLKWFCKRGITYDGTKKVSVSEKERNFGDSSLCYSSCFSLISKSGRRWFTLGLQERSLRCPFGQTS